MSDRGVYKTDWPTISVAGPDAASWLHALVTCDVMRLSKSMANGSAKDGRGVASVVEASWGLLLTKTGKIQAEFRILGREGELLIAVCGGDAGGALETLDSYLVMEDAEIAATTGWAWVVVVGELPESLAGLVGAAGVVAPLPGWEAGEQPACLVGAPVDSAEELASRVCSESGLPRLSEDDWRKLRLNAGLPSYAADFGSGDNPHQASLEQRTVDWQKGCYLGQEVVYMQHARGKVKRRLVRLEHQAKVPVAPGAPVTLADGTDVGQVTTAGESSSFARLGAPHYEPGTQVFLGGQSARVLALAPVD